MTAQAYPRISAAMQGALEQVVKAGAVQEPGYVRATAKLHGVTEWALYRAMKRAGVGPDRCPTCGRMKPRRKVQSG